MDFVVLHWNKNEIISNVRKRERDRLEEEATNGQTRCFINEWMLFASLSYSNFYDSGYLRSLKII